MRHAASASGSAPKWNRAAPASRKSGHNGSRPSLASVWRNSCRARCQRCPVWRSPRHRGQARPPAARCTTDRAQAAAMRLVGTLLSGASTCCVPQHGHHSSISSGVPTMPAATGASAGELMRFPSIDKRTPQRRPCPAMPCIAITGCYLLRFGTTRLDRHPLLRGIRGPAELLYRPIAHCTLHTHAETSPAPRRSPPASASASKVAVDCAGPYRFFSFLFRLLDHGAARSPAR